MKDSLDLSHEKISHLLEKYKYPNHLFDYFISVYKSSLLYDRDLNFKNDFYTYINLLS